MTRLLLTLSSASGGTSAGDIAHLATNGWQQRRSTNISKGGARVGRLFLVGFGTDGPTSRTLHDQGGITATERAGELVAEESECARRTAHSSRETCQVHDRPASPTDRSWRVGDSVSATVEQRLESAGETSTSLQNGSRPARLPRFHRRVGGRRVKNQSAATKSCLESALQRSADRAKPVCRPARPAAAERPLIPSSGLAQLPMSAPCGASSLS